MLDPSSNFMNLTIGSFREWDKLFTNIDSILMTRINSPALAKFNVQSSMFNVIVQGERTTSAR